MNISIQFTTDGTANCLWTEAAPLHELGRLEIHRASKIEFNNCKGWCRRVAAADGSRSCKHTGMVDLGTADQHCKATHSYEPNRKEQHTSHPKNQVFQLPRLGHRKFAVGSEGRDMNCVPLGLPVIGRTNHKEQQNTMAVSVGG